MLCPPLQAQVWTSNMSKIGEPWEGRRQALRSVCIRSLSSRVGGEIATSLQNHLEMSCGDALAAFLVTGARTGTTPAHSCWRDCWGRGAGGRKMGAKEPPRLEGYIQRGGEIQT